MRFHHPLDEILGSTARVRILRFLSQKGGEWNGRQIAAHLGLNPVTAHRALRRLYEATLLDYRKAGTNFLYSLRDHHYLVEKALRPLFEREASAIERLRELLKEALGEERLEEVVSVALYGSVARGGERPTSDLDLLVLVKTEKGKRRLRDALNRFSELTLGCFGNPPALYLNSVREAQEKMRRLPLLQNVLKNHRAILGRPLGEVLRGQAA